MSLVTTPRLSDYTTDLVTHEKALDYVRFIACMHDHDGPTSAAQAFALRWPKSKHHDVVTRAADLIQKGAITAGSTSDATWAGPLASSEPMMAAFLAYSRPFSLLGRIPNLRKVPFNVSVPVATAPGTYAWAAQGAPKVVTKGSFATATLGIAKASGIIVLTAELFRAGAEEILRTEMAQGIAQFLDTQLLDPAVAAVANTNPASLTYGISPIAPSGTSSSAAVKDVGALIGQFLTNNPDTTNAVLLMTPTVAAMLAGATNSPTLTLGGGSFQGVPVVTSGNVGTRIVMIDAGAIFYADDGIAIDVSRNASVQMDSVPDNPVTAATVPVSFWQTNLVGLRADRLVSWTRGRTSAVAFVSPTAYLPGT